MKYLSSSLLIVMIVCQQLSAMDNDKAETLLFNVGGEFFDISRSIIERSESSYLNNIIKNAPAGRIFIDQDKEVGKLTFYFIRYKDLPKNVDENVAKIAARDFGLKAINECLLKRNKKYSKVLTLLKESKCPHCDMGRKFISVAEAILHMSNMHGAKIVATVHYSPWSFDFIFYKLPEQ